MIILQSISRSLCTHQRRSATRTHTMQQLRAGGAIASSSSGVGAAAATRRCCRAPALLQPQRHSLQQVQVQLRRSPCSWISSSSGSSGGGWRLRASSAEPVAANAAQAPTQAITLTPAALEHLKKLRAEAGSEALLLRVGVKQGGCSGLSYVMDFESAEKVVPDDYVVEYEGGQFKLAVDAKSLLYLFGMELDWSSALIGGGFKFNNPNAEDSCGCGKSFGV